ncbi:hypothetical protein TPR58_21570 [Sphingomonas sp. HF-S3]|uniref:J domain-containing protein n=1 Tax=Sphingomonas rustica TaxID=3103142 RepID=A0ABV0BFZ9_9SPHN
MTWRHPCWAELGIEPTSDKRAIRVAYTRKLKTIDPESDPQAFIALREAYEHAQQQAEWVDLADEDEDDEGEGDDASSPALYDEDDGTGYAYSPVTGARVPIDDSRPDPDAPWRTLHELLLPDGNRRQPPFDEAWHCELGEAVDAALADPRLEQVGFLADADRWFAETLARSWPASGSVLLRVAKVFGWYHPDDAQLRTTPAIDFINARLRDADSAPDRGTAHLTGDGPPPAAERFEQEWADTPAVPAGEPAPTPPPPSPPSPKSPWAPISPADADAAAEALSALLAQRERTNVSWPSPRQKEAMLTHWQTIISDPRMDDISFYGDADRWFARQLAHAIPWSDPLIIPAAEFFGWMASDGTIRQDWSDNELTRRYRTLKFMGEIEQRSHPLNPAWRDLVTPDRSKTRSRVPKSEVRELLMLVRRDYPDLEGCFDSKRLDYWERVREVNRVSGGRGSTLAGWIVPILLIVFLVIRAMTSSPAGDATPSPVVKIWPGEAVLADKGADMNHALKGYDDALTWSAIQSKNPALAKAMNALWDADRKKKTTQSDFRIDVSELLDQWSRDGRHHAPFEVLSDETRLTLETAKRLGAQDLQQCSDFFSGDLKLPNAIVSEFAPRRYALYARRLLSTGDYRKQAATPKSMERTSFSLPDDVVTTAIRRAGLSRERFFAALTFKGSATDQCTGRIALMETVLELPRKQSEALLRVM